MATTLGEDVRMRMLLGAAVPWEAAWTRGHGSPGSPRVERRGPRSSWAGSGSGPQGLVLAGGFPGLLGHLELGRSPPTTPAGQAVAALGSLVGSKQSRHVSIGLPFLSKGLS